MKKPATLGTAGAGLSRTPQDRTLLASPYWMMKRPGMDTGGFQYNQLRAFPKRLAVVAYQNTAFYKPLTQEHERVTLDFFSTYLPTRGRGTAVDPQRAWRIGRLLFCVRSHCILLAADMEHRNFLVELDVPMPPSLGFDSSEPAADPSWSRPKPVVPKAKLHDSGGDHRRRFRRAECCQRPWRGQRG